MGAGEALRAGGLPVLGPRRTLVIDELGHGVEHRERGAVHALAGAGRRRQDRPHPLLAGLADRRRALGLARGGHVAREGPFQHRRDHGLGHRHAREVLVGVARCVDAGLGLRVRAGDKPGVRYVDAAGAGFVGRTHREWSKAYTDAWKGWLVQVERRNQDLVNAGRKGISNEEFLLEAEAQAKSLGRDARFDPFGNAGTSDATGFVDLLSF